MPDSLPVLTTDRLTLRPMRDDDVEALTAIVRAPGVREWWGSDEDLTVDDGGAFVIEVGGERAGYISFSEEPHPDYRHAGLDLFLAPPYQRRGLGPEALRTAVDWLRTARGHHRFTIDPAAANANAIKAYEKAGFSPVGTMRRYERGADGEWHDNLLMDLLADEL